MLKISFHKWKHDLFIIFFCIINESHIQAQGNVDVSTDTCDIMWQSLDLQSDD
jgi:hypothetical protein